MITIPDFNRFKGLLFKDVSNPVSPSEWECVGYGDSTNAPYVVGARVDNNGRLHLRTFLFKQIEFLPPSNKVS